MKKINCIIVDDEPLARELVALYVSRLSNWVVVAQCRSVAEAYEPFTRTMWTLFSSTSTCPTRQG
jgi:response regulator of citrate/malate metabolism